MRSMRFSIVANVVALFLMGSTLNAGDQSGRGSSTLEVEAVTRAVQEFMAAVAKDVSAEGPHAWHKYLSQENAFFMASNGQLVFESGEAAEQGIRALEQRIDHISLQWGQNFHIDPLSDTLAQVGVPFHETLVEKRGNKYRWTAISPV